MTRPPVPVSREVIEHHGKLHARQCPLGTADTRICPCGRTHAITCTWCGGPVFYFARPGTWCEHIAEMVGAR